MVSAIILAYNRYSEVLYTISKLKAYQKKIPFNLDIIVVDNASTDGTTQHVKDNYPDITIVTKENNNGIAGWNEGFKIAKNKYFLILDDDSHIETGLEEAVQYLENNPDVGLLALNITTGPFTTAPMKWKDRQDVVGFFGCGAILRKELFEKIGGFSEWLHVYAHEWEYALRVWDGSSKVRYFENSSIIHRASTANRSFKRIRIYSTRNEMGMVYKYFGEKRWKYIFRMWANNLKRIKVESFLHGYYDLIGSYKFLKIRKSLIHTPVSKEVQDFFVKNYVNTYPVFGFIKKRIKSLARNVR